MKVKNTSVNKQKVNKLQTRSLGNIRHRKYLLYHLSVTERKIFPFFLQSYHFFTSV